MKPSEYYENRYPLEELLPELDDDKAYIELKEMGYVFKYDNQFSPSDNASAYYTLGYNRAKELIENKLIPKEI